MTTYFTSDWHVLHRLVSKIRGFIVEGTDEADLEAHNEKLRQAGSILKPDDIVWWQGDLVANEKNWKTALELIGSLPGRKRLICGNHDPAAGFHREAWKFRRGLAAEVFETIQDFGMVSIGGRRVLLSHYPYSGVGSEGLRGESHTPHEERFTEFRLTDRGRPLLHGHTHGPEKLHFSQAGTPQVHIGLDAWGMKLVSENEVAKLLDTVYGSAKVES